MADPIPSGRIEGVDQGVSRVVMGTMQHVVGDLAKACRILDGYVQRGGNALDTAFVYGTEATVGEWLKLRGNRKQIVLIGKGACDNHCEPQMITDNLLQSLGRMQTDYVDLFLMHRDNPAVPVGEFVDVLNEHVAAGRIKAFGGSNWTWQRIQEANDYAGKKGLRGFAASSPNFTLARWNEPMWAGCCQAVDAASRQWYTRTRLPLLSWSSQANGFMAGQFKAADRDNPAIKEIVRVWYNDDNFRRLQRAEALAGRLGVTAIQIALAYVLCQPMSLFALVGPQKLEELDSSLAALKIKLSAGDLAWLNLETNG